MLPSEAEWEKAVRGNDKRIYPWGDEPDPNCANYYETGIGTTSVVGCFANGASPYGAEELSGNVWEWCSTIWRDNYKQKANDQLEGDRARVLRGGSFINFQRLVRCAFRLRYYPHLRIDHVGFRVVLSPLNISLNL